MDTGNLLNGAKLDDPTSAQLDTAILEYATPTYSQDLSAYARSASTDRGAKRELQRIEAGRATVVLDNRDGRFTPFNTSSPYSPNILPMRRIRIMAEVGSATYDDLSVSYDDVNVSYDAGSRWPIFQGFVDGWPVSFPGDRDMISTVELTDGFKVLALALVSGDFPQQSSSDRVLAILQAISWPAAETDIETGVSTVPAVTLDAVSALQHIQDITHAEGGRFFMARDGKATFRNRTQANTPDLSDRTWADDGTGMSYTEAVRPDFNDELILNDVHLTRPGGVEQVAFDSPSQGIYGIRSSSETDIQLVTDGDVLDRAELQVERYSNAVLRVESLVDDAMQHQLWENVLAREIDDIVQVIESRTDIQQVSVLEGIGHEISSDGTWSITLSVSPTSGGQVGILDDTTWGILDSTAILAH